VPRPRKSSSSSSSGHQLSPGHASYVLQRLIAERRVSAADVQRYAGDIHREIGDLERRLQELRGAGAALVSGAAPRRRGRPPGRPAAAAATVAVAAAGRRGRRRRRAAITAEQSASRQLQGKYLSLIRQIPASRRSQFSRIAKERGREAAIRELQAAVNK